MHGDVPTMQNEPGTVDHAEPLQKPAALPYSPRPKKGNGRAKAGSGSGGDRREEVMEGGKGSVRYPTRSVGGVLISLSEAVSP